MMHQESDESLNRLTQFAPLEAESKQSGGIFSRLFKRSGGNNDSSSSSKELSSQALAKSENAGASNSAPPSAYSSPSHANYNSASSPNSPRINPKDKEADSRGDDGKELREEQRRTLSSVMRRLGNILEKRGQTPQAYKDSDFRQYWMPDSNCKQCYECGDRFTTFRRRHHCRICGQIFCSRCCNQEVPGKIMGYTVTVIKDDNDEGYLRVCTYCCKVVLNFAQNINTSDGDVPSGLKENLQETRSKLESYSSNPQVDQPWVSPSGRRSKPTRVPSFYGEDLKLRSVSELDLSTTHNPFDITPQSDYANPQTIIEERKAMLKDSVQLRELWLMIQDPYNGIELQSHRHRLRTYANCIIGSELVDWLVSRDKANSRVQAVVIGQALLDARWLECITLQQQIFSDSYTLYKPGETAIYDQESEAITPQDSSFLEDDSEPQWFREIGDESDSELEMSSDLNKIPSTLSAPHLAGDKEAGNIPKSQSVFYIDSKADGLDSPHLAGQRITKARARHSSGTTINSYESVQNHQHAYVARINSGNEIDIELAQRERDGFVFIGCKESPPVLPGNTSRLSMDTQSPGSRVMKRQDSVVTGLLSHAPPSKGSSALSESVVSLDPQLGWQSLENLREENGERKAYQRICKNQWELVSLLIRQLLNKEELSFKWSEVIMAITKKISKQVCPDVKHEHDDMDIRQYVQIKKIPGANRSKTEIISGVVCSKNIQHRKMKSVIQSPRILLLRGSIEYQRIENKFSSLEPQILQEHEYLKNCVARIAALKPDILLVEKTVSRVGQEFILDTDITLVSNVKPSVMERVARFTQADIVTSIDGLVSKTTLGFCTTFKVQNYKLPDGRSKCLMYFDGCAHHLGCTVILRGGLNQELTKVKKILQFITYVAYHLRLELSYLMDSFAMPPPHPDENILEISEDGSNEDAKSMDSKSVTFSLGTDDSSIASSSFKDGQVPECVVTPVEMTNGSAGLKETVIVQKPNQIVITSEDSLSSQIGQNITKLSSIEQMTIKQNSIEQSKNKLHLDEQNIARSNLGEQNSSKSQRVEHLEVMDNQSMRVRSNSSDFRRFSDFKKHKRSISDYSGDVSTTRSSTEISDFSDPLHKYQHSKDESIFHKDDIKLRDDTKVIQSFKKALTDVIVSISPLMKFDVPYLETIAGASCILRQYFPTDLYWSAHLDGEQRTRSKNRNTHASIEVLEDLTFSKLVNNQMSENHEFMEKKLTVPIDDQTVQMVVADFRARGGRLIQKHLSNYQNNVKNDTERSESNGMDLWQNKVDCLDPANHQRLAVLFSSFSASPNCSVYCVSPWVVTMDYYGRNDITLGGFLERYCFKESYHCPSEVCDGSIVDHTRRFVHDNGCLTVMLKKLDQPFPNFQNNILMWAWCRKCRQVTPVVPMSLDTWSMSFAKYLELHFHGNQYGCRAGSEDCVHNLHQFHFQYFGYKQIVASFKYSETTLREIALPPVVVFIKPIEVDILALNDQAKMLNYKGTTVFNAVVESLLKLQHDPQYINFISDLEEKESQLQNEQSFYRKKIEALSSMLNDLTVQKTTEEQQNLLHVIQDLVLEIKRQVARAVVLWNERFQEIDVQSKKLNKSLASQAKLSKANSQSMEGVLAISEPIDTPATTSSTVSSKEVPSSASSKGSSVSSGASASQGKSGIIGRAVDTARLHGISESGTKVTPGSNDTAVDKATPNSADIGPKLITDSDNVDIDQEPPVFSLSEDDNSDKQLCEKCSRYSNRGVSKIITQKCGHEVCRICYYENNALCPVCPKHLTRRRASMIITESLEDLNPSHFGSPRGHWPPASHNMGQSPQKSPQLGSSRASSNEDSLNIDGHLTKSDETSKVMPDSKLAKLEGNSEVDKPKEKPSGSTGMKNIISSLLYTSGAVQIQMPFTPDEHHLLPPCDNIPVIVYDEEPSSIIAYALSSKDYHDQLEDLKVLISNENNKNQNYKKAPNKGIDVAVTTYSFDSESGDQSKKGNSSKVLSFFKGTSEGTETAPKKGSEVATTGKFDVQSVRYTPGKEKESVDDNDETDFSMFSVEADKGNLQKSKQKETEMSYHIELQYNDSTAKFYCRIYYAEQFRKLRKLIFPEGEERFIRSLSRCYTWLARGGKSGSTFCKTQDDRFILKQMSKYEVQSFIDFAPHYFHYITKSYNEQKPTALAKILGVFKIGFKNNQSSASLKQDVLVMENLFYNRKITQIFDLKGSVRNRLVNTSGKRVDELVLLDENLLKLSLEAPMYIRPHSKTVLTLAITNDTQFLSSHLVMDYSLLVGIDDNTKELVVGIIDYIRTFTWDKKLEMVVKSTYSHIGGQGKMPTVVSPELYRSRFLEAMDRYFLHVPDRWTGLGQNVDC